MLTHQRVCVLQVAATVAPCCGCLTDVFIYFQLFEPCKTGADKRMFKLHRGDGGTKWSAMVRRFPFLEETSEKIETWWTERASTDNANGPNRKTLTGLNVENVRGDGTPYGPEMSLRWVMVRTFFHWELLVQVNDIFLQCNDNLWNAFERRK